MDERTGLPVILRGDAPGEVHRGAGDVGVDVDPAGEDDHAAGVDRAAALDLGDDPAIRDADVLEGAEDPVRRIMDLPARYPQHGVSVLSGPARTSSPACSRRSPLLSSEQETTTASRPPPGGSVGGPPRRSDTAT